MFRAIDNISYFNICTSAKSASSALSQDGTVFPHSHPKNAKYYVRCLSTMKWNLTLVQFCLGRLGIFCGWRRLSPFSPCKLYAECYKRRMLVRMHETYRPGRCPILRRRAVGCSLGRSLGPQQARAGGGQQVNELQVVCGKWWLRSIQPIISGFGGRRRVNE